MTPIHTRGHLLFADDDDAIRGPLSLALRKAGFQVDSAATAYEASGLLQRSDYDLLIMDINMPGNEELQMARLRHEGKPIAPIMLITGYPSFESAVSAVRYGVVDYITKPIDPEDLFQRVDAGVRRGRTLRFLRQAHDYAGSVRDAVEGLTTAITLAGIETSPPEALSASSSKDPLGSLRSAELAQLSQREREVVRLVAMGCSVQDVAKSLALSPYTIRNHLKSVFAKLRVKSQVQLLGKLAGHPTPERGAR
jgi:DNA-binding NarL/FixJ family response regulator